MKINKIKISALPFVESLRGFFTIGVGPDGKSYKADLGKVQEATDAANLSADNADAATAKAIDSSEVADQAAENAILATESANAAANGANQAAQRAEDSVLELSEVKEQVETNTEDIEGIRQQMQGESHFRGYFETKAELDAASATANDYAYLVEIVSPSTTSNKWVYNGVNWIDSGDPVPDQVVPKSNAIPSMNGAASVGSENAYAAGDHRHPTDVSRAALSYVNEELSKKQNTLIAGANITIAADGKTISAADGGVQNVNIPNFNTFNPTTLGLAVGESCNFNHYSTYTTTGRPSMGSGTDYATNNPLSSIYFWAGSITRINSNYYMLTAYGQTTSTGMPHMATRIYNGSTYYQWIINTDFSSKSTSGYIKLPSGLMLQWGQVANRAAGSFTVTFPFPFINNCYYVNTSLADSSSNTGSHGWTITLRLASISNTQFTIYQSHALGFTWFAIGAWK